MEDLDFFSPEELLETSSATVTYCKNNAQWTCSIGSGCADSSDNKATCQEYIRAGVDNSHSPK